jgi:hypothetical protein
VSRKKEKHLYDDGAEAAERRAFEKEYPGRGDDVYGRVINKVSREQAEKRPGGVKVEHVEGHVAFSDRGKRFFVRPHPMRVSAHPHGHGEHRGPCSVDCRAGRVPHSGHRRRRR